MDFRSPIFCKFHRPYSPYILGDWDNPGGFYHGLYLYGPSYRIQYTLRLERRDQEIIWFDLENHELYDLNN